jgi:quercetin dioxygenase-like cupin family protein
MPDEPARTVALDDRPWDDEAPGIRSRSEGVQGSRWALVEYAPGARREEWCTEGHRGFVVDGAISYEFDDGHPRIEARAGQAFLLPGGQGHRGTNLAEGPTRLFLIDDPA